MHIVAKDNTHPTTILTSIALDLASVVENNACWVVEETIDFGGHIKAETIKIPAFSATAFKAKTEPVFPCFGARCGVANIETITR